MDEVRLPIETRAILKARSENVRVHAIIAVHPDTISLSPDGQVLNYSLHPDDLFEVSPADEFGRPARGTTRRVRNDEVEHVGD